MRKEGSFVHLNTMSSFTPGSIGNVEEYARTASLFGMPAIGLADVGHTEAWASFDSACTAHAIKPVFGVTVYPYRDAHQKTRVSLLVQERQGFHSINRLLANTEKPLTPEILSGYTQGLIAIAPRTSYESLREVMDPQRIFYEYMNFDDQSSRLQLMDDIYWAQYMNAPVVSGNRVWHTAPRLYDQFLSVVRLADHAQMHLNSPDFSGTDIAESRAVYNVIKQHQEPYNFMDRASAFHPQGRLKPASMMYGLGHMIHQYEEWQRACNRTQEIADICEPEKLPRISIPEYPVPDDRTVHMELYNRALAGLQEKYGELSPQAEERLLHELDIVTNRGLSSLFLIVQDIASFADSQIAFEAVGSVTGSLLAYALGISNVDPIKNNLLSERFLGPDGTKLPDIDLQVDAEKRSQIYDFLFTHFPEKNIYPALIATFPTYGFGSALETILSTFGYTSAQISEIKRKLKEEPPERTDLVLAAQSLASRKLDKGFVSTHPSKVIFFDQPVADSEYSVAKTKNDRPVVPLDKEHVKDLGAMEFDAVSSFRLTLLQHMLDAHHLKKDDIPHEDAQVLDLIFKAQTLGIPDIETPWMRQIFFKYGQMKQWQNLSEGDMHVAFALSRPGVGDEYRDLFYKRLRSGHPFSYDHPDVDEILHESYGVAVFQEQIMMLSTAIAGFDTWEADAVRRQISKERDENKLRETAGRLFQGALTQGISQDKAQMLVDQMVHFGKYGFVKGHAIALMSNIAYKLAWLKKQDPQLFMDHVKELQKGHYYIRHHPEAYEQEE